MNHLQLVSWCLAASVSISLCGCGGGRSYDGPQRYPVSGSVSVNGVPLKAGNISFLPTSDGGSAASAAINNGTYEIQEEHGPIEGTYQVKILGYETVSESKDADLGPTTRQILPSKFNESTTLEAVISSSGENRHDFDLSI